MINEPKLEIIYVDETTFNLWQTPSRMWFKPGMTFEMPTVRGPSITLIGAISVRRGLVLHSLFVGSNNQDTFATFLTNLKLHCAG
jgi:hypothetical protein